MTALIELQRVSKVYGGGLFRRRETLAVDDVSFAIDAARPAITGLAGESGSGKTTIAKLMLGFLTPTDGRVLYQGQGLEELRSKERRAFRREVQAVFQDPFGVFNPFYRVDHLLDVPIAKFGLAGSASERHQLLTEALEAIGLRPEETLGRFPHQLSGGQRQRITIARALLMQPKLIIADEPVSMVDASRRATILESLSRLNREYSIAVLYITHDLTTAFHICDDILILYQGSVAEAGDVEQVIMAPRHPYTQLLVNSIPWPDPNRRWGEEGLPVVDREQPGAAQRCCKFAPRCPRASAVCLKRTPPLFRTDNHRAVACFLFDGAAVVSGQGIREVLGSRNAGQETPARSW
jgi:peptide/nickel transport system ATP-binding protein